MSLYAEYLHEKTDVKMLESPNAFATYVFTDRGCWIKDIYVKPEFRKTSVASDLANMISEIAKSKGIKTLLGSVIPSNKNSTDSLKVLLAYGMTLESCGNDFILFKKEL